MQNQSNEIESNPSLDSSELAIKEYADNTLKEIHKLYIYMRTW